MQQQQLYAWVIVMKLVASLLVCHGARVQADSSAQQQSNKSLFQQLTETATLYNRGLRCLPDGQRRALYEGLAGISWVKWFTGALTASSKRMAMRIWMMSEQDVVTGSDFCGEAFAMWLRDLNQ